jgi:hypothetical protein
MKDTRRIADETVGVDKRMCGSFGVDGRLRMGIPRVFAVSIESLRRYGYRFTNAYPLAAGVPIPVTFTVFLRPIVRK